jgi:MFS family permease
MTKREISYLSIKILSLFGIYFILGTFAFGLQINFQITSFFKQGWQEIISALAINALPSIFYLIGTIFFWFKAESISKKIFPEEKLKGIESKIKMDDILILTIFIIGICTLSFAVLKTIGFIYSVYYYSSSTHISGQMIKYNLILSGSKLIFHWLIVFFFVLSPRKVLFTFLKLQAKFSNNNPICDMMISNSKVKCDSCGKEVNENAKFCESCGEKFDEE